MHVWKPLIDGTVTEYGDLESMALELLHGVYGSGQMSVAQSLHTTCKPYLPFAHETP